MICSQKCLFISFSSVAFQVYSVPLWMRHCCNCLKNKFDCLLDLLYAVYYSHFIFYSFSPERKQIQYRHSSHTWKDLYCLSPSLCCSLVLLWMWHNQNFTPASSWELTLNNSNISSVLPSTALPCTCWSQRCSSGSCPAPGFSWVFSRSAMSRVDCPT